MNHRDDTTADPFWQPPLPINRPDDMWAYVRFFKKIERGPDGCWNWGGFIGHRGYGQFWYDGRACKAHRVSFAMFNGEVHADTHVHHTCYNKRCVNPAHLIEVKPDENSHDYNPEDVPF